MTSSPAEVRNGTGTFQPCCAFAKISRSSLSYSTRHGGCRCWPPLGKQISPALSNSPGGRPALGYARHSTRSCRGAKTPLERFRNRCIRLVRVVRRFSAAFVAANRPLKPLRSKTSAALAIFSLPLLRGPKGPHYPHGRIHQLWNRSSTTVVDRCVTLNPLCGVILRQ